VQDDLEDANPLVTILFASTVEDHRFLLVAKLERVHPLTAFSDTARPFLLGAFAAHKPLEKRFVQAAPLLLIEILLILLSSFNVLNSADPVNLVERDH
jgi:hypothetical protein